MYRRICDNVSAGIIPLLIAVLVLTSFSATVLHVDGSEVGSPEDLLSSTVKSGQVVEDLDYLYERLKTVHLDIHFSRREGDADEAFLQLKDGLRERDSWTIREIYNLFAPFVAGFNDAHTSLVFNDEFNEYCEQGGVIVPFYVYLKDDSIVLTETVGETELPRGSRVLSVNGVGYERILREILDLVSYERKAWGLGWGSRLFPIYMLALYGPEESFKVVYRAPDGTEESVVLPAVSLEEYSEKKSELYSRYADDWNLEFVEEDVALLTINTFAGSKKGEFEKFLEESFREIEANMTNNLIVDLRNNGGGSTNVSDLLYSYASWKPYRNFARVEVKYSDPVLFGGGALNPFSRAWEFLRTRFTGEEVAVYENDYRRPPKREYRFDGDLFLLVGRNTFSTAVGFAAVIKDLELGTIIGEETGGLPTCFGDSYRTELPNSRLSLRISYKRFVRTGGFDDRRGVLPDVAVDEDPISILDGKDRVLDLAISLAVGGAT